MDQERQHNSYCDRLSVVVNAVGFEKGRWTPARAWFAREAMYNVTRVSFVSMPILALNFVRPQLSLL